MPGHIRDIKNKILILIAHVNQKKNPLFDAVPQNDILKMCQYIQLVISNGGATFETVPVQCSRVLFSGWPLMFKQTSLWGTEKLLGLTYTSLCITFIITGGGMLSET